MLNVTVIRNASYNCFLELENDTNTERERDKKALAATNGREEKALLEKLERKKTIHDKSQI